MLWRKENLVHAKNVGIGFATKKIISDVLTKKKASARQVFEFQIECLIFLQSLVAKLLERCPLQSADDCDAITSEFHLSHTAVKPDSHLAQIFLPKKYNFCII